MMTNPYLLTIIAVAGGLVYFAIDAIREYLNAPDDE